MGATRKQDNRTAIGQQTPVSVLLREFRALITQRIRQLTGIPSRNERLTLSTMRAMHGAGAVIAGEDVRWDPVRERVSMTVRGEGDVPHIAEWSIRGVDARTFEDSRSDQLLANCFWAETPAGPKWCGLFASGNTGPGQWRSGSVIEMRRAEGRRDAPRDDRLTQLGAMASTLSHELKQPLATIAFAAENGKLRLVGQTDTRSEKALEKFDKILEQVERARNITGKMLAHAKAEADATAEFDLEAAIRAAQSQAAGLLVRDDIQYGETAIPEHATILGFSRLSFELIMLNGIRNAVQAIAEARAKHLVTRGRIDIAVKRIGTGSLAVSIIDDGAGISPEIADKLFSPFATSKQGEEGNGIGLHMCRQLVEKVGGTLDLVSNPDARGARLVMTFPESAVRFTSLGSWQQG